MEGLKLPKRLAGLRVLVVDDDADTRELAGLMIRVAGGSPTLASTLAAAMDVFEVLSPDVIVSDIRMPGTNDGTDFIKLVRGSRRRDVPAIAISGNSSQVEIRRAIDAGFDAYLVKPLTVRMLVDAIADAAQLRTVTA
ncbi:MAG: response regulator [Polyangiaceae bacterium]